MITVTITNQKGGVGKTSTALTLSAGLAVRGFRVLAVDADPQTNLTYTAGIDPENIDYDLQDLFTGAGQITQTITHSNSGFDIVPGSPNLNGADAIFVQADRETLLKRILEPVKGNYDYCIIDTPPTLGILSRNALTASDGVIIPVNSDIMSVQGLLQLNGTIKAIKRTTNPSLQVYGLLLTRFNPRANINAALKTALENAAPALQTKVYNACIREAVAIRESQFSRVSLFSGFPKAKITEDYNAFIDEFLKERV